MLDRFLFQKIDNTPLVVFRIFLGTLIALEGFGAIATGWVRRVFVEPDFTFHFIGFDWLQPLPGYGMYFYFAIMGTLGICIALGYRYRFSMVCFALMWWAVYLMQKTSYNNHYYLLALIASIMCFLPAHRTYSLDARRRPDLQSDAMYAYVKWIIIFQLFIVYTYAAIAKLYGDWLNFTFLEILLESKSGYPIIGGLLEIGWFHKFIGISGFLFDLLIVPALLWKPTRNIAFGCSIFFHLFNSIVFQIGIFPYMALAFTVFFYEAETVRRLFLRKKKLFKPSFEKPPAYKNPLLIIAGIYFLAQLLLPVRHHVIEGDVLWTEEGHRLSWRMMLRNRTGRATFRVVNKADQKTEVINLKNYLTRKQERRIGAYPDFIWQFAQYLKEKYAEKGIEIEVFANARVSINGRPPAILIDPKIDLAAIPWDPLRHHHWILPPPWERDESKD
ncbi:MAG: HTTM domain-containing protein [Flavobacteriaceae bacterium]